MGCPLPSTPEDEAILDNEMSDVFKAAVLGRNSVWASCLVVFVVLLCFLRFLSNLLLSEKNLMGSLLVFVKNILNSRQKFFEYSFTLFST